MTIEEDKQRTAAFAEGSAVPSFKKDKKDKFAKRPRGRPKGSVKEFISELPAPMKRMTFKPDELFTYLQSIPKDKLTRVMLVFYRYFPICDITEGGERDKWIKRIAGESHPFVDDEWMKHILHLFGCGTYGCYLNETNAEGSSQTRMECKNIETIWDPDSYPPVVDPKTLIWTADKNQMYVQWLRSQGIQAPSEDDKEREEMEMQISDTINKLTDTVIAQANRINTPVPQIQQQPGMAEKLSFEMASSAIDMFKEKAKVDIAASAQQSNGLDLVDKVLSAAREMSAAGRPAGGEDSTMKLFMTELMSSRTESSRRAEAAEERHARLLEKMLTQQANPAPVKTLLEQMTEMAQMRTLISEAFGVGGGGKSDDDDEKPAASSWPMMLIQNAPQLLQTGVQMWGQFNNSMAMMTRMKELDAMKATGQVPPGAAIPNSQPAIPEPTNGNGQHSNPAPVPDEIEQERIRQEQIKYAPYHPIIAAIGQPLITHLNDPGQIEDGQLSKKDGYDFAEWFIAGQGRLMYDQVKTVGLETLMGAIKSYPPLWQQIGGIEDKVKEFITEFLGYDDLPAELAGQGQEMEKQ